MLQSITIIRDSYTISFSHSYLIISVAATVICHKLHRWQKSTTISTAEPPILISVSSPTI